MFHPARTGLIAVLIALALPTLLWAGFSAKDLVSAERTMWSLVNVERGHTGLAPLEYDDLLAGVARAQSQDMLKRRFFSHTNPDKEGPGDRAVRIHPELIARIGENLHHVMITPGFELSEKMGLDQITRDGMASLMKSPGHRANILNSDYDHVGIGYAASEEEVYITQVFGEEVCLLDSSPPRAWSRDSSLTLSGRLLASHPLSALAAFLKVPDPNAEYPYGKGAVSVGGKYLDAEPLPDRRFRLRFKLDAGQGEYQLMLGRGERLIPGPVIRVK
jgi:uncharacterized protein YkwD